jgi:hypothetical protein
MMRFLSGATFRAVGHAVVPAIFLLLSACGGSPTTSPTTSGPQTEQFAGTVQQDGTNFHILSVNRTGVLTVTLSWANSSLELDLFLTNAACTCVSGCASAPGCQILTSSKRSNTNSQTVAINVNNGDTVKLAVVSLARGAVPYTAQATVQ